MALPEGFAVQASFLSTILAEEPPPQLPKIEKNKIVLTLTWWESHIPNYPQEKIECKGQTWQKL